MNKYKTSRNNRAEHDFYATDPLAAKLLLNVEQFDKNVWECASGENHLANVFRKYGHNVRTSDIVRRTSSTEVLDFLSCCKKWNGDIITNPPYKNCLEFVKKALSLVSEGHKVAMFLRLQFLESMERWEFFKDNPPKIVYVSSKRIKCGKDGDFNSEMSSIQCYAWFVWEKGYKGNTTLSWINHGEQIKDCPKVGKVSDEDILTPRQQVKVAVGQQHMNLFVQRVERDVYQKYGLDKLHYMKEPINKAATCLLFTDSKGRNVAFVGLLNNPSRTYPNGVLVSRIVVFPKFQGRGLAVPILDKVGGMLAAKGLQLFINTEDKKFGKRLDGAACWVGTTFDKKVRKYYNSDGTHKNRKSGVMRRKKYVGSALHGYNVHLERVAVLRSWKHENEGKMAEICGKANDNKAVKPIYHPMIHHSHAMEVAMSGADGHCGNLDKIGTSNRSGSIERISSSFYDLPHCSARGTPLRSFDYDSS